ncbi:hypothetical protein MKX01_024946, partial [Papaver californicum]
GRRYGRGLMNNLEICRHVFMLGVLQDVRLHGKVSFLLIASHAQELFDRKELVVVAQIFTAFCFRFQDFIEKAFPS